MELIDEKFVSRRGEEIYLECVKRFGEERILGVFSIGLYNYNSAETMDEVKYMAIYIPTLEKFIRKNGKSTNCRNFKYGCKRNIY